MAGVELSMNFACLYMPDFSLQASLRGEPEAFHQAIALVEGRTVIAATGAARAAGVTFGMTMTQAAQRAAIRRRSKAQENSIHAALLDCARSSSPRVEDTAEDTALVDLQGLEKLFGPPSKIASRFLQQARELDLTVHLAIAANPDTAILAARGFPGATIIPFGEEARKLGTLPVNILNPRPETLNILHLWGIDLLKELAELPLLPLSERLGQEGVRLQELALGKRFRSLIVSHETEPFEESWELEAPATTLGELDFILASVLNRLSKRLSIRSLAAQELQLRLELAEDPEEQRPAMGEAKSAGTQHKNWGSGHAGDDGLQPDSTSVSHLSSHHRYARTLSFPSPVNDARLFFKLWRLRLESDLPRAPVTKVEVVAQPGRRRTIQGGLFTPRLPDPEKLELTLARVAAVVGSGNVGSPQLADTHKPHAFHMARFNPQDKRPPENKRLAGVTPTLSLREESTIALRLFRPPVPTCVQLSFGCPRRLTSSLVRGKIVAAAGPWRKSGGWWEESWEREEWDIEIRTAQTTALYSLYRDCACNEWYLQGEYD